MRFRERSFFFAGARLWKLGIKHGRHGGVHARQDAFDPFIRTPAPSGARDYLGVVIQIWIRFQTDDVQVCVPITWTRIWIASSSRGRIRTGRDVPDDACLRRVTREHRENLAKVAKQLANKAKESLRRVRSGAVSQAKKTKEGHSEDTVRLVEKQVGDVSEVSVVSVPWQLTCYT